MNLEHISVILSVAANISVVITLLSAIYFFKKQKEQAFLVNSSQIITQILVVYSSPDFLNHRRAFAKKMELHRSGSRYLNVYDYSRTATVFEHIGYLVRNKIVDKQMFMSIFGWSATMHYKIFHELNIEESLVSKEKITWDEAYCELKYLHDEFIKTNSIKNVELAIREFITCEIDIK